MRAVCRPRVERQAHIYQCRIKAVQRIIETVPGRKVATLLHKRIEHLFEDIGVTFVICISQGAPSNSGQAKMVTLLVMAPKADPNITEAGQSLRLSEQQNQQLLPAAETLGVTVTTILINTLFEPVLTNELH